MKILSEYNILHSRGRTERTATRDDWAFKNIGRSRKIAEEVRRRNNDGQAHVDWLDVVEEYEWELWLV
jgi:hypothetical protein